MQDEDAVRRGVGGVERWRWAARAWPLDVVDWNTEYEVSGWKGLASGVSHVPS